MFSPNNKFIRSLFQSIFILVFSILLVNCGGGGGDDSDGDNNLETDILNGSYGTVTFNTTSTGIPLTTFTPESYSEDIDGVMSWGFIVGGKTLGSTVYSILIDPNNSLLIFSEAVIGGETKVWLGSSADVIISADSVDFNNAALLHSLVTTSDFTIVGTLTRGDPDTTTTPETPSNSSRSIVSGTQLGSGTTPNSQLRKSITFSLDNPHSDFTFGAAYAAKITATSNAVYWMVEITNNSDQTHCFIKMSDGRFLSSDGSELGNDSLVFVNGDMQNIQITDANTNTCLLPGSSGHFIGIDSAIPMDQVSSIVFDSLTVSSSTIQAPELSMTASSYVAEASSLFQGVDLTVQNAGPAAGVMGSLSLSILLDDNDDPLIFGYFSVPTGETGEIASNQSGIIHDDLLYEGMSNKLIIYLDYEAQTTTSMKSFASSQLLPTLTEENFSITEEYLEYAIEIKNQNEYLKQLLSQ